VTTHIALLRAVNVGGTGKLPMSDLRALCEKAGFKDVRTYIASGNVILSSPLGPGKVKAKLEAALLRRMGKPCAVMVRSQGEMGAVIDANPFPDASPAKLLVLFLDEKPPADALASVQAPGGEELALMGRELFIHFPSGMGTSKLKIPLTGKGTGRNMNTVRKLFELAGG
jgi:uncharacterized protein (DUF1697 family)